MTQETYDKASTLIDEINLLMERIKRSDSMTIGNSYFDYSLSEFECTKNIDKKILLELEERLKQKQQELEML